MAAITPSTSLVPVQPVFTDAERLALAGYRGVTREAYTLDLCQFTGWCLPRSRPLFSVHPRTSRRSHARWKPRAVPARPSPGGSGPGPRSRRLGRSCAVEGADQPSEAIEAVGGPSPVDGIPTQGEDEHHRQRLKSLVIEGSCRYWFLVHECSP